MAVKVSSTTISNPNVGDNVPTTGAGVTNPYSSQSNISNVDAITNKYIGVYEADSSNKVVKFNLITLTNSKIAAPEIVGTISQGQGTNTGTTAITALPALPTGATKWQIKTQQIPDPTIPGIGTAFAGADYVVNSDIAIPVGWYLELAATDNAGNVVAFKGLGSVSITNIK